MRKSLAFIRNATMILAPLGSLLSLGWAENRNNDQSPSSEWKVLGDTIEVVDNHGGDIPHYDALWAELAASGKKVRIVGNCVSACTMLLAHMPRDSICVTPAAAFGFHLGQLQKGTDRMWGGYPDDIRAWIHSQGGLTSHYKWLRAPEIFRFFKAC
jgi:hypothetical protein